MKKYMLGVFAVWIVLIGAGLRGGRLFAEPGSFAKSISVQDAGITETGTGTSLFIENIGQYADDARFYVWGGDQALWLADDALWVTLFESSQDEAASVPDPVVQSRAVGTQEAVIQAGFPGGGQSRRGVNLKLSFVDANPHPRLEPFNRLDTRVSFFIGDDPDQWYSAVPVWGGVRYVDLYPGIDLEVLGEGGRYAQRLVARPGADLSTVRLRIEGAEAVTLDGALLHIATAVGEVLLPLPTLGGVPPDGWPIVLRATSGETFDVIAPFAQSFFPSRSLSPQDEPDALLYSTFLGGEEDERGMAIAVDEAGSVYVTGLTKSARFPTTPGAFDPDHSGGYYGNDVFVVKLNAEGSRLAYATFLGGSDDDGGDDLAVDSMGQVYMVGWTQSTDFATTAGAFDRNFGGGQCQIEDVYPRPCPDGFVVKLNSTGTGLVYATYLGGSDYDFGYAVALDDSGAAYVSGSTYSDNFPTTPGAFDTTYNGDAEWPRFGYWYGDVFVAKINPAGTGLEYGTYLGGSSFEAQWGGIALLPNGEVVLTGITGSDEFPTTGEAFDPTHNGGADVYVTRLSADGGRLVYSTFVGGDDDEQGNEVVIDSSGAAYVAGWTYSADFPSTAGAFDPTSNGGCDGFLVKVAPGGDSLIYATFLGGSGSDGAYSLALDGTGRAFVTGWTQSSDFPITDEAFDSSYGGGTCGTVPDTYPCADAYVVRLDATGGDLVYASFLGGSSEDWGDEIAIGDADVIYLTGAASSTDFPVTAGAFDTVQDGDRDVFVTKLTAARLVPTVDRLEPFSAMVGGGDQILTVYGGHFAHDSVIRWNGADQATTFVSNTQLRATIPAAHLATAGYAEVTVFTPPPGGGTSNSHTFSINNPHPAITGLSPTWTAAGGEGFTLTVHGDNFVRDSVVRWNGMGRMTTFVNSTQLQATVPAADIASVGHAEVTVSTPGPGGGVSNAQEFIISDPYELDDTCTLANPIPTNGAVQIHTFHDQADEDWVSFQATAAVTYVIEARVPPTSTADLVLELHNACSGGPLDTQDYAFSPDIRLTFRPPADGAYYLHLLNHDPAVYGPDAAYHLSVRALEDSAQPGALVLVAGRLLSNDPLQDNIHHVTNTAYRLFRTHGYPPERIYYLATDLSLDADDDGQADVDALATAANLEYALTTWAVDKVGPDRAFTLYLMDHGSYDKLYLDRPGGEWVTPGEVDNWLDALEAAALGVKVNIIIEACHAGSFIDPPEELCEPGRVVVASTGAWASAWASQDGAVFSDAFLDALDQGMSLYGAFEEGRWAVGQSHPDQTPWLDDDGDGVPNDPQDGGEAAQRGFAFAGTLAGEVWPPYIVQAEVRDLAEGQGGIWAEVRDDERVKWVWAVVYPPSWEPPEPGEEMGTEPLPVTLQARGNGWYGGLYTAFDEVGTYRIVIQAEDENGLQGRPQEIKVQTKWAVYLPLVVREQ